MLQETQKERMKPRCRGAALATLFCTAAAFGLSIGPEQGWSSVTTMGLGLVAVTSLVAFVLVERTAQNPIVPLSLFLTATAWPPSRRFFCLPE